VARAKISFNAIVPKDDFDFRIVAREVIDTMKTVNKPEIKRLFEGTTDGWEDDVSFRGTVRAQQGAFIRLLVQPVGKNADLYSLVSKGSPPHRIEPRNAPFLSFQTGYRPATKPGSLSSQRKARFGPFVQAQFVDHPGFEPRDFDIQIAEKYDPRFQETMARAMTRAGEEINRSMRK
jgi:hypothetical protein